MSEHNATARHSKPAVDGAGVDASAPPPSSSRTSVSGWQPPSEEQLQKALPQYEIQQFLARGGMGAVYKARQRSLDRLVAIKVLPTETVADDPSFATRFRHEAQTLARLNHPSIVHVYDFGETEDCLRYFIMEFMDGTDVAAMISEQGRLPLETVQTIIPAVCEALAYAHGRGVIHRDIKPANILIDREGRVKVADFGIARMIDRTQRTILTRTDMTVGTQEYAAPEMFNPGATVDHRADIYAVGVMLYQMLTGEVPRIMFKLPSLRRPELGTRFDALICKALEPDPADRFESAAAMKSEMESAWHGGATAKERRTLAPRSARVSLVIVALAMFAIGACAFLFFKKPTSGMAGDANGTGTEGTWSAVDLKNGGWVADGGGFTTDKPIRGYNAIESDTRDAAVRMTYLLRDASGVQITARGRVVDGKVEKYVAEDELGALQIGRMMPNGSVKPLVKKTYPAGVTRGSEHTLEFRIAGDTLTATLNGTFSISAKDDALAEGSWAMVLKKGALVKKLEVQTPQTAKMNSPEAKPKVIDLLPLIDVKRDAIEGEWSRTAEGIAVRRTAGNVTARMQLPYEPPSEYDFEIEFTPGDGYSFVGQSLSAGGHPFSWLVDQGLNAGRKAGFEKLNGKFLMDNTDASTLRPQLLTKGRRHVSRVEVRKGKALGWLDGKKLVEWGSGSSDFARFNVSPDRAMGDARHLGLIASDRDVVFHKITVHEVSDAGKVEASVPAKDPSHRNTDMPSITNWQDVTAEVREKARAIPNLILDADSMRHSGRGNQAVIPLTRQGVRDYAVRLRFDSDGQIGLRSTPGSFLYVLCQRNQTLFHHYEAATGSPVLLRPNVPHPADFNSRPIHEMLVTMQGPTVSVWLDGRFVGEADDPKCPEGDAKLVFTPSTTVRTVEVAELPATSAVSADPGFQSLFDGKSLDGWLSLNGKSPPGGWRVADGAMTGREYTAVMTQEEFGDFDLSLEWKVNPQGNGGIYYRVAESGMVERPMKSVEFNLMDTNIPATPLKHSGAAFDVQAPSEKAEHPSGEWNTARLRVQGTKVEQWINNKLVCRYDLTDAAVRDGLKRAGIGETFASVKKGHIALQDWTGEVFYRNVRIRELPDEDPH